jgi:7,8-dihydropterin-6-yl-methyl-4-(beta-D-ribofuranosyl)aminobenzene 5'-phosphate synthase
MKISVLCENTTKKENILSEHGLSLFIETEKHKILFDMGQSDAFLKNAKTLGIDLSTVDIAILSHGHYDHGGGLRAFLEYNEKAKIYINRDAFGDYYNADLKYIGLDKTLRDNERIVFTDGYLSLDEGIELVYANERSCHYKIEPNGLKIKKDGDFFDDSFLHEQYLLLTEKGKRTLISGCSHKGVLNIMHRFSPDIFVGGFHFMKTEPKNLSEKAKLLSEYKTDYYTCHCTGIDQFEFLKNILGDRLSYISSGDELII